jgi:hypothetical protein
MNAMRIQQSIISILFVMIISGCTKDLVLSGEATKPFLVIEGRISNMWGPYYVRVTRTTGVGGNSGGSFEARDSVEAITNALVIITDDTGVKDTLIPGQQSMDQYTWYIRDSVHFRDLTIDSVFTTVRDRMTTHGRGFYQTTKLQGKPGHTYYLEVQIGDSIFRSSAYMPPVPELEGTEWVKDTTVSGFPNSGPIPVAWFKDPPNEKNYYAFYTNWTINAYRYDYSLRNNPHIGTFNLYDFYCFDDQLLKPGLNRLAIRDAHFGTYHEKPFTPIDYYNYHYVRPYPIQIRLHSLTKETYEYFNTAFKQLDVNGKIYKPTPISVHGNISGGALGLFYATHVSDKMLRP